MITQVAAIANFLRNKTHADLADLYSREMEVQVNVAQDNGERIEGEYFGRKWHGWSDGIQTWKSFRIPYSAHSEPVYEDKAMSYDLAAHAEGIGMTGWDWVNKLSRWVAFDFDAITGHSEQHQKKLTDEQLREIRDSVNNIPWVTTRYSTSGKGLHLYVQLQPVATQTHTEHAALARAILGMMAAMTGIDFQSKVDACGGNMWVWHRKMQGTNGLQLIKTGEILTEIPQNWREHLTVISGKRKRVLPSFVTDSQREDVEKLFEELSGQKSRVALDSEHKRLIQWLNDSGSLWYWLQDHNMIVTHTVHLKEAHDTMGLKGVFDTISKGSEKGADQNCYAFPRHNGVWEVRRYTPGVEEATTWEQDGHGWTRCFLNSSPDLRTAARSKGGVEDEKGRFHFRELEVAKQAAQMLGVAFDCPPSMGGREAVLKEHKDGRLIIELERKETDTAQGMSNWRPDKTMWKRIFNRKISTPTEPEVGNYDDTVRHLLTTSKEDYGWVMKNDGEWRTEPITHVKLALQSLGLDGKEVVDILGSSVIKAWTVVNHPFEPEYPGDRQWNKDAAQFRFLPSEGGGGDYSHWMKILKHCGKGLDQAIKNNGWAKANGITTGADYLKCWIAALFQFPTEPLPYLFMYGTQNNGKSIFHEALEALLTKGVARADTALVSQSGFNAELEHAILCVVEEIDLKRNTQAYNRIKDWVTSRQLPIHRKGETPYTITNTTHWVQCANQISYCPVFQGDSRITMINVPDLEPWDKIPKPDLIIELEKEAPAFLRAILDLEIPRSGDRLKVPVITTEEKLAVERANRSAVDQFLEECCYRVSGEFVTYGALFGKFVEWLTKNDPGEVPKWTKPKFGKEFIGDLPKGRSRKDAQFIIGNLSFSPPSPGSIPRSRYVLRGDFLELEEVKNV